MSILATKRIEDITAEQLGGADGAGGLQRVLGAWQLVMLGVGAVIGTGIFVLTGQAAAANAGPAIVIAMVLAGLTSMLAALCYSEFAASVPVAGSAYTYAYATLGEFIAWVIGWDLILEYALGAATVAVGTGDLSQIDLPKAQKSGLRDALDVLKGVDGISFTFFESRDVVRHPLVARIVNAYDARDAADPGQARG